jgi:hypothetical protein
VNITRAQAKTIGEEIREKVTLVAEKHCLAVDYRGVTYDSTMVRPRFELKVMGADREEFGAYAHAYGLEPSDFGAEFTTGTGRTYRITGIAPRRRKYPISAEEVKTGKGYKFPALTVSRALGR